MLGPASSSRCFRRRCSFLFSRGSGSSPPLSSASASISLPSSSRASGKRNSPLSDPGVAISFGPGRKSVLAPLADRECGARLGALASDFSLPNNDCFPLGPCSSSSPCWEGGREAGREAGREGGREWDASGASVSVSLKCTLWGRDGGDILALDDWRSWRRCWSSADWFGGRVPRDSLPLES